MTKFTHEERRAYVRGALTVCLELRLQEHIVVELCQVLKIAPEELEEFSHVDAKLFVPGILGEARR